MTVPITGMPTFTTGAIVHQADLNLLSTGINNLSMIWAGVVATRTYVPACTASLTGTQSIANATDQTVSWNTASPNNDTMWSSGSPTKLTVVTAGVYVLAARAHFVSNGTGTRAGHIMTNGTSIIANSVAVTAVNAVGVSADTIFTLVSPPLRLPVGTTIYFSVFQNSGGALSLSNTLGGTMLSAIRIGL
jgi:hypothetical protein